MKIAVFSNAFPVFSETFVINQIVGLMKKNIDVEILTNEYLEQNIIHESVKEFELLKHLRCIGYEQHKSKFERMTLTVFNVLNMLLRGNFKEVISIVRDKHLSIVQKINIIRCFNDKNFPREKFDNIICHFGDQGYYLCKLRDLGLIKGPISTVFHAYEISRYEVLRKNVHTYKKLFQKGDLMLPISEHWKFKLIELGCDNSKIEVHRMGVDLENFSVSDLNKPLSSTLQVIQVGRLTQKKAILDSIKAVAMVKKKINVEFTIIGEGDLYDDAKNLIDALDAKNYIYLVGKQPQEYVKEKLSSSDVALLPSVKADDGDMEGIPVALMESMAMGIITLSTLHSGIPELIETGTSGFLVNEHDVEGIAQCLLDISDMELEDLVKIRKNAREVCYSKFNNEILNSTLSQIHIKNLHNKCFK